MIIDKQNFERRNHKHHGLWSVLVVEGWYDTGYIYRWNQQNFERRNHEDHGLWSALVVEGWYDMGYIYPGL
jgi:hypothetical protein